MTAQLLRLAPAQFTMPCIVQHHEIFPHRNPIVDVALAGFALLCIGATARYTKRVIWAASLPQPGEKPVQTVCKGDTVGYCAGGSSIFSRWRNPGVPEWRLACRG